MSILLSSRNHSLTFGVSIILLSVVMLIFLLHKTHEQLMITRGDLENMNDKFGSLTRQFESLYEYKERLENSFVDLKEKKSTMTSQTDSLKSELAVLKQSHRTEMQRLQDELDLCRRHEEMAMVRNQPQRDEALPPQIHVSENSAPSNDKSPSKDKLQSGGDNDIKVINSLSKTATHHEANQQPAIGNNVIQFIQGDKDAGVAGASGGLVPHMTNQPPVVQPSMDPNQDPVGNVFI